MSKQETRECKRKAELPRERLLEKGPEALTDAELLAILAHNGIPGYSAVATASTLLERVSGLSGLADAPAARLQVIGVGRATQAKLLAAAEIARRMLGGKPLGMLVENPGRVVNYLRTRYSKRDQEVVGAIYLNARNYYIGDEELFRGTISRAVVEPRPILRGALDRSASGIIIFHTHPSGDPAPSAEDILFTRRLAEAGEVLGISLVDHLIIGAGGLWLSMKERGAW